MGYPYDERDEDLALKRGFRPESLRDAQATTGLSNRELAGLGESSFRRLLLKLKTPNRAVARERFLRLALVNDRREVPARCLSRALAQLDEARARTPRDQRVAGVAVGLCPVRGATHPRVAGAGPGPLPAGAGISPSTTAWRHLGPGNIGGRTRGLVIHPTTPLTMWAGTAGGGIWRTDDGAATWTSLDDNLACMAVSCLAIHPQDPNLIYAGTGEGFENIDAIQGAGILFSRDGRTWTLLSSTMGADFQYVNRIAILADGLTLLVATSRGLFRSTNGGTTWASGLSSRRVLDVKAHPTDPARAVAGGQGATWWTADAGLTWHLATGPGGRRVELAYAVADPTVVYAAADLDGGKLWRSTDGGKTYATRAGRDATSGAIVPWLGKQGWYDNAVWAGNPRDASFLILGGIDLWRSRDGGKTLGRISDWRSPTSAHADQHTIVAHPQFDGVNRWKIFVGNDGGIASAEASTVAPTSGWTRHLKGYGVTQFYAGAGSAASGTMIGGAQDNGSLSRLAGDGPDGWREFYGGDGGFVAVDPVDPLVCYGEYVGLQVFRNDNGAASDAGWDGQSIVGQYFDDAIDDWNWKPAPFTIPDAKNDKALFIAPFVLDPNDRDRLLAGGASLWATSDPRAVIVNTPPLSGPTWRSLRNPIGTAKISAIAIARGDSARVWIGYDEGEVAFTTDSLAPTPAWTQVVPHSAGLAPPQRICTRILIHPTDPATVYVTFGGYAPDNVWRTTDSGTTWTQLAASIPDAPVRAITHHPRRHDFLYLGTEVGLFTSEDAGGTWSPSNEGPTACPVYDLFWMGERLVAVSHGRGMFDIDLSAV